MKYKVHKNITKEKLLSLLPSNVHQPSFSEFSQYTSFALITFPIDFQKSVVKEAALLKALQEVGNPEQIVVVAGQMTIEAQLLAHQRQALCLLKRDNTHTWSDASLEDIKISVGSNHR